MPFIPLMKRKIRKLKRKVHKLPTLHRIVAVFAVLLISFFSIVVYSVYSAPQYKAEVKTIKTDRAEIAYYVRGKGEPLILLPGFGMTMQHWDPALVQKLSMHNQVIMFDYRGVGASGGNASGTTQDIMIDDVVTLMDDLKIERAHLVGWSLGSFVAQGLTQKYPDRVDHLVLIATAPGGEAAIPAPKEIRDKVQKSLEGSWEKAYVPMMFLDAKDTEAYLKRVADAQKSGELPKSKGETLEAKIAHQSAFADEGKEEARYLELGNIESPTLLITGDKDELTSVKNAELVAERIPKSELVIMPDAGHAVMFEENDDVARLIRGFLR